MKPLGKRPKSVAQRFRSWSFSRLGDYRLCPLKAKLKHLDKVSEPSTPGGPLARGQEVHRLAEQYLTGGLKQLPDELRNFKREFTWLRKQAAKKPSRLNGPAVVVEGNWCFTRDWKLTAFDDWDNCWLRVKVDVAYWDKPGELVILDWKTGKAREDSHAEYSEQLELYAMAALHQYAGRVQRVTPFLMYVDSGDVYPRTEKTYLPKQLPELTQRWEKHASAMLADTRFTPRPNSKCQWCFYRASNKAAGGGQCKF